MATDRVNVWLAIFIDFSLIASAKQKEAEKKPPKAEILFKIAGFLAHA